MKITDARRKGRTAASVAPPPPLPAKPWDRMKWVLIAANQNGLAGRVLLAVASFANDDGQAWPSHKTIATAVYESCLPHQVRRVRTGLKWLEANGWLTIEANVKQTRGQWTNLYTLKGRSERGQAPTEPPGAPPSLEGRSHSAAGEVSTSTGERFDSSLQTPRQSPGEGSNNTGQNSQAKATKPASTSSQVNSENRMFKHPDFVEFVRDLSPADLAGVRRLFRDWRSSNGSDRPSPEVRTAARAVFDSGLLRGSGWYELSRQEQEGRLLETSNRIVPARGLLPRRLEWLFELDSAEAAVLHIAVFGGRWKDDYPALPGDTDL